MISSLKEKRFLDEHLLLTILDERRTQLERTKVNVFLVLQTLVT